MIMVNVQRGPTAPPTICAVCGLPIRRSEIYTLSRAATTTPGRYLVRYAHLMCDAPRRRARGGVLHGPRMA